MKRVTAWAGIIILLALYAITFVSAVISSPQSNSLFWVSAFSTVTVPVIIFVLLRLDECVKKHRERLIKAFPAQDLRHEAAATESGSREVGSHDSGTFGANSCASAESFEEIG